MLAPLRRGTGACSQAPLILRASHSLKQQKVVVRMTMALVTMVVIMMMILTIMVTTSRRLILSDDRRRLVRRLRLREQRLSLLSTFGRLRLRILVKGQIITGMAVNGWLEYFRRLTRPSDKNKLQGPGISVTVRQGQL